MTYGEVSSLLLQLGIDNGQSVYAVRLESFNTTALYVLPVRWFIALEGNGVLCTGTYVGYDLRLVGDAQIPFSDATPEFIRDKFHKALIEQAIVIFGGGMMKGLSSPSKNSPGRQSAEWRDIEGGERLPGDS
jgi:hypothetical protein